MNLAEAIESASRRAVILKWMLIAGIVVDVAAMVSGILQHNLLSEAAAGMTISMDVATANDSREQMVGIVQIGALVITAIGWLAWFHRSYDNLNLMGKGNTDYTTGWAVGAWFVPFLNLARPYTMTRETWLRSATGNSVEPYDGTVRTPAIGWWWAMWIISAIAGRVYLAQVRSVEHDGSSIDALLDLTVFGMVVDGLGIIVALLALRVVDGIDKRQQFAAASAHAEDDLEVVL